jgi:hypothetical protein
VELNPIFMEIPGEIIRITLSTKKKERKDGLRWSLLWLEFLELLRKQAPVERQNPGFLLALFI